MKLTPEQRRYLREAVSRAQRERHRKARRMRPPDVAKREQRREPA